jgi:flagellar basal body-associated protein FliL
MGSKSVFFILIVVIAILTLSLAALAGYIFIVQGNSGDGSSEAAVEEVNADIPSKDDLVTIELNDDALTYNLKNDDPNKVSVIQVKVALNCYKQLSNDKKAVVTDIVANYSNEIKELVVRFFLEKTINDVKNISVMDEAKTELAKQINSLLNEGVKKPEDVVYKVIFSEWIFM